MYLPPIDTFSQNFNHVLLSSAACMDLMVCSLVQPGVQCSLHDSHLLSLDTPHYTGSCFHSRDGSGVSAAPVSAAVVFTPGSSRAPGTNRQLRRHSPVMSVHRTQRGEQSAVSENSIAVVISASTQPLVSSEAVANSRKGVNYKSQFREEAAIHRAAAGREKRFEE